MKKFERFSEQEIPYKTLARFGLTQQMIDDLPASIKERLMSSRSTPLLPVLWETEGKPIKVMAKVALVRVPSGEVDARFMTQWESNDLSAFNDEQRQQLLDGMVICTDTGQNGECFCQYNSLIKQVMMVPAEIVRHNVAVLKDIFQLDTTDENDILSGQSVEHTGPMEAIAARIDLNEQCNVRVVYGNKKTLEEDITADNLPKYNFGYYGCWVCNDNNMLSYVPEEEYDEEMDRLMERESMRKMAQAQMQQMGIN